MIQKVSGSGIMEEDMKVSGKMIKSMVKVRNSDLLYDFLIRTLFDDSKGKWYGYLGIIYEGEWKDDQIHGQGKKEVINLCLIDFF